MTMEDFKRPDHNDFALSSELRERRFTGIRLNSITNEQELWVEGHIRLTMDVEAIKRDETLWHRKYADIFDLTHVASLKDYLPGEKK